MKAEVFALGQVHLSYGAVQVLRGVDLSVSEGEFLAVIGPSGCGKSTLLALLAGHERPAQGEIRRPGRAAVLYQQGGLFPWLTATQNVALALRSLPQDEARERARALLAWVGLEGFGGHFPHELSGGMKQRVELARALAGEPQALLLDEPFSALDYLTRLRLRGELARLLEERPVTTVLVTHDIEEAVQLADRVVLLSPRPAAVEASWEVGLPRRRSLTHPRVVEVTRQILAHMGLEEEQGV